MMKIIIYTLLFLTLPATTTKADEISIFIVTGQSNARSQYALGVGAGLRASGLWENVVIYTSPRNGNWLSSWVDGSNGNYSINTNYTEDLWEPNGTSELQILIGEYESDGHTVSIEGLFWFQGEGDTGGTQARAEYDTKLVWMVEKLRSSYGNFDAVITLIDWNHDLPGSLAAIGRTPENIEEIRTKLQLAADQLGAATFDSSDYPRIDLWHVGDTSDSRGTYGLATDLGADEAHLFIERAECQADLDGNGVLNFFDISKFLQLFQAGCP